MPLQKFICLLNENNARLTIDELKAVIIARAYSDFEFFCRYFFSHYCELPFSRMHLDFCKAESDPQRRGRKEVIAAPRGHAKTTFKTLFKVLHAIVYGYDPFIIIASFSMPQAIQKVKDVLHELSYNELLINVYGSLAPKVGEHFGIARWGKQDFTSQNGVRVMAVSRGQSLRGIRHGVYRPTFIICDDVESLDRVYELKQRQKTLDWFQKDILKLGQTNNTTNITVVGTVLHPDSLISMLLKTPGWQTAFYQAIESFAKNQPLWNEYRTLYTDLSNSNRVQTAHTFYLENQHAMLAGVKVLWPESDPYEKLIQMQIDEGFASFQSEKQNEPFDPERQIFDMRQAKRFRFMYENGSLTALQWLDGSQKLVPLQTLSRIVAFHDPAMASSKDSDYAAIVVVGQDDAGYLYCLDVWLEKQPVSRQLEQAWHLHRKWRFEKLYLETNNFQGVLQMNYRDMAAEYPDQHLEVRAVQQTQRKESRISTLEPLITNGYLLFAETLPEPFITQLHLFPTTHDDGPDALQGAVAQLKKPWDTDLLPPPTQVGRGGNMYRSF